MGVVLLSCSCFAQHNGRGALDRKFVEEAYTGGLMEVSLGRLAITHGKSQRVKDFGKMMIEDHNAANDELKKLAAKKGWNVPSSPNQAQRREIERMSAKTGDDFDGAYIRMMVEDHKKDLAEFREQSTSGLDEDLKTWARQKVPVLKLHLDRAQAILHDLSTPAVKP